MIASAPPAIMTSASPRWMILNASPMAWLPVAHAVTTEEFGPLAPKRIEISPEAMLTISIGMKNGRDPVGPLLDEHLVCHSRSVVMPPMPEPTSTPKRGGVHLRRRRARRPPPPSRPRRCAYLRKGSSFRSSFLSMYFSGSKPLTSPAMRVETPVVSNRVMGPMPDRPSQRRVQNSSAYSRWA